MSDVTAVDVFDQLFYTLTREQIEANSPQWLRKIIRIAFDTMQPGWAPGPTFRDVIDHYEAQTNYLIVRGNATTPDVHEALDTLLNYRFIDAGVVLWMLPSIVENSKASHYVGKFQFDSLREALPLEVRLIKDFGWDI